MKEIDIEGLSYEELVDLNHRIVDRLKKIDAVGNLMQMMDFELGETVQFEDGNGRSISGFIAKFNKKTVSVVTKEGQRWNVSPRFLQKANPQTKSISESGQVIDIRDHTAS